METVCVRVRLEPGSLPRVREWASELQHAIDAYHQRFKDETFAERSQLELLVDFENL